MVEWSQCLNRLRHGDYSAWPKHEWIRTGRFDTHSEFEATPTFGLPIWEGQEGVVLVNADCGMGDTIHYSRWLPLPTDFVLRCDSDFSGFFEFEVASKDNPVPAADYIIHMMAVPGVLGVSEVSGEPYLSPQGDDPLSQLSETTFHKVGICWAGNPFNPRDAERSIPVEMFSGLLPAKMFSLVKHEAPPEDCFDVRGFMQDWNMTAHLLSHMDLIISVDTAIAHLAGAMGLPTWLLLPEKCDWRWGDKNTTFWYDSVRIFRGNHKKLISEVRRELENYF